MLSLIIPTYNEARNIGLLIQKVMVALTGAIERFEIIVVDDDSPDGTWRIAIDLAKENPHLKVIRRTGERGLATAVVAGWKAAEGDILGVMDGDLQHDPNILGSLIQAISTSGVDIVIASRHIEHGGVSEWSFLRRTVSWGATCLATFAIPGILRNVRDPMSGFFLLKRMVIASTQLMPRGYKILLEVLAKGAYRNVIEVPYIFEERKEGSSKLGPRQYGEYILHLARLAKETGEFDRFLRFCTVGVTGMIVNQAALWFLTEWRDLYYIYSSIASVEAAIISNFILNEYWTFRDRTKQAHGAFGALGRFLKFNLICAIGGMLNTATLWTLTESIGLHYLFSNLIGIGISTVWNYGVNANITWGNIPIREEIENRGFVGIAGARKELKK